MVARKPSRLSPRRIHEPLALFGTLAALRFGPLVWLRGGDYQEVLAADRAVRRVLERLRPASGEGGRTTKEATYRNVIGDLAAIYRRRTRKRPTSSPTGDFAALVRVVTRLDNPKDEIAAALSRKLRRKS